MTRLLFLTLFLGGCRAEPAGDSPPDPRDDPPRPRAEAPRVPPELHALPTPTPPDSPLQERGVGVVAYADPLDFGSAEGADTIVVRAEPDAAAAVVARLIRRGTGVHTLEAAGPAAVGGAIGHGYEDIGLPLLEAPDGAGWLRVHYAAAADGAALDGWTPNDGAEVAVVLWSERLAELPLFFLSPDSIRFFESPDGPPVEPTLAPGSEPERFDYILHPLETRGAWMRVELVTPKDYCFDPPAPRRDTLWIRYLTEGGEPRVWYYTRGC